MQQWHDWKTRNSQFTWKDGHKVFVKIATCDSSVKVTQWNHSCLKTTWAKIRGYNGYEWLKVQDRVPIKTEYRHHEQVGIIILVHSEQMIMPHNHRPPSETPPVAQAKRRAFSAKQRGQYWNDAWNVFVADCEMWDTLAPNWGG